ncbi:MAG: flavodoxin domain-containing protein, partial [Candidatus Krumholzibacteria bacterium]|nr:flavodoxin domain-containing protein [Candidatus Krumholzibacteria bacterium]
GEQTGKALDALSGLDIDMIAPSHGLVWRSMIPKILGEYSKWSAGGTEPKALIVYDTMWGSTGRIALSLEEGLSDAGVPVTRRNLKAAHISDIMTDILTSRAILIGSPTLNNGILPSVGALLTYIRGLRPGNKIGLAFGSYGWGGQSVGEVEEVMRLLKWELPLEKIRINYIPDENDLAAVRQSGRELGKMINGES